MSPIYLRNTVLLQLFYTVLLFEGVIILTGRFDVQTVSDGCHPKSYWIFPAHLAIIIHLITSRHSADWWF